MQNLEGETRPDPQPIPFSMRLKLVGLMVRETITFPLHPSLTPQFNIDRENKKITVKLSKSRPKGLPVGLQAKLIGVMIGETFTHPLSQPTFQIDMEHNKIYVTREARNRT